MSDYVTRLASITDADEQMDIVEPLARELYDDSEARTSEIADAILRMYERNSEADGFGTFGTLNMVLEEIEPDVLRPIVRASLDRQESWAAQEIWEMLEDDE